MSGNHVSEAPLASASHEELMSVLFANMVIQQTNMALMFLGKVPHPETGKTIQDVESAKMFIDQLEMLEFKTKGNLNKREEGLLRESLMALRMSFVEAVEDKPSGPATGSPPAEPEAQRQAASPSQSPPIEAQPSPPPEEESRKKFSKKY